MSKGSRPSMMIAPSLTGGGLIITHSERDQKESTFSWKKINENLLKKQYPQRSQQPCLTSRQSPEKKTENLSKKP